MTAKQHKWYLREWSAAYRAHWSGVRKGEVLARPDRPSDHPLRQKVIAVAQSIRLRKPTPGGLTPDDLRHACHQVAVGKDLSSWKLSNKQLDRVIALFRQLAGINLAAILKTEAAASEDRRRAEHRETSDTYCQPDADRKRCLWSLSNLGLPPAYMEEISLERHGTRNWRSLPSPSLFQLLMTCRARAAARAVANLKKAA
jgi:hypothetical protein